MIHRAILTWFPPLWKKNRTLFFRYSEQKAENYSIRRAIKVPVNTREQKNNVGTQKMHMTHSRLKPGFEGINKHSNWLRPAGQEKKKSSDLSFESVEILHEQKSLEQILQATELCRSPNCGCSLKRAVACFSAKAPTSSHQPKGGDDYPAPRRLQEFCAAAFCFGD